MANESGKMKTDPVCGMKVAQDDAAAQVEHEGKHYYFCSKHCAQKFEQDPASFLNEGKSGEENDACCGGHHHSKKDANASKKNTGNGIYTCPMHSEIEQKGSGSCPKCGMDLEPKEGGGKDEEEKDAERFRRLMMRFIVAAALSVPVSLLAMFPGLFKPLLPDSNAANYLRWAQFVLTAPIVLGAGWMFSSVVGTRSKT